MMNNQSNNQIFKQLFGFCLSFICLILFVLNSTYTFAGTGSPVLDGGKVKLNLSVCFRYNETDPDSWIPMFEAANELLWNATECQIQFGQIDVFVQQNEDNADILIDTGFDGASARVNGFDDSAPHGHVYLTNVHKIIDESAYDARGYFGLNHELGHYVFGLYDEYQAILLNEPGGSVLNWDYRTGTDCVSSTSSIASIMDGGTTVHPTHHRHEYCTNPDDGSWNTTHNSPPWYDSSGYVVLEQSYYHDDKSCWEVLAETMANRWGISINEPISEPDDEVCPGLEDVGWRVYSQIYKQAICLDRSTSMDWDGGQRIYLAKMGANLYVNLVEPDDELAVTSYANSASTDYGLTTLTSANEFTVKNDAVLAINGLSPNGGTAMGEGLEKALDEIEKTGKAGSEAIILLSDGYHNSGIDPDLVIPDLNARGVVVYTIGVGNDVDEETLSDIATATGGEYFHADDVTDLLSPIYATLSTLVHDEGELAEEEGTIAPGDSSAEEVVIDEYCQKATFILHWRSGMLNFNLIDPSGNVITPSAASTMSSVDYVSTTAYSFYRVEKPKVGKWVMKIDGRENKISQKYTAQVLSDDSLLNITLGTEKNIYNMGDKILIKAMVAAYRPVAGAEVSCRIKMPNNEEKRIKLYDDGQHDHGDVFAEDGYYSNFFSTEEYKSGYGSYKLTVEVNNLKGRYVTMGGFSTNEKLKQNNPPLKPFSRIAKTTTIVSSGISQKPITGCIKSYDYKEDGSCVILMVTDQGKTYTVYLSAEDCKKVKEGCVIVVIGDETESNVIKNARLVDIVSCEGCDKFIDEAVPDTSIKDLNEVTDWIEIIMGKPSLGINQTTYSVSLKNISRNEINLPIIAVVSTKTKITNSDGKWVDGSPYFDYSRFTSNLVLKPGESTKAKSWTFGTTLGINVRPEVKIYARIEKIGWLPFKEYLPSTTLEPLQEKSLQVTVNSLTTRTYNITAVSPGVNIKQIEKEGTTYNQLSLPRERIIGDVGDPALPGFTRLIALPRGAELQVQVEQGEPVIFEGLIYPVQEEPEDNIDALQPPFKINTERYQSDRIYPESFFSVDYDYIRGMKVAIVNVVTARVNSAKQIIYYYPDLKINTTSIGGNDNYSSEIKQSRFFEESYSTVISNYKLVKASVFDLTQIGPIYNYCDFLIITPNAFLDQAEALKEWKIEKGIITKIATLNSINSAMGGTTADHIRDYIKYVYENQNLSYVLLLGDAEFIPPHYVTPHPTGHFGTMMGTDLYYAEMDDEGYFPDLGIGRIPVDTSDEAQIVVDKIINYEQNPPNNSSFYQTILCSAFFQDDDRDGFNEASDSDGRAEREFTETMEIIRNFFINEGYPAPIRQYTTDSPDPQLYDDGANIPGDLLMPGFSWDGNANEIIDIINDGTFLILHRDHGGFTGWSDPYFRNDHLEDLANGDLLPVVLTINCQTGWFDNETDDDILGKEDDDVCFAEEFLKMANGGAVAMIAATRNSPSSPNNALTLAFLDCMWNDVLPTYPAVDDIEAQALVGSTRLGDALNYAKFYIATKWSSVSKCKRPFEIYHVLGDPTMELWTENPNPYLTLAPIEFTAGKIKQIIPIPEENVLVSIIQNDIIVAQGISQNGQVVLDLKEPLVSFEDTAVSISKPGSLTRVESVTIGAPDIAVCDGDLNGDGTITPNDALVAFQCFIGSGECPECADVNKDGECTPVDALCIFRKFLGQPNCIDN